MIIITGGAGFIGSAITAELNRRGEDNILIVDMLDHDEKWKNLRKLKFADYIEADDFFAMLSEGRIDWKIEAVIHMGACSDTTETDCSYLVKNNYDCSKMLANWSAENGFRFIYASSAATYGGGEKGFNDDLETASCLKPLNMYGYSKHMFDLWAIRTGLVEVMAGLKFFNVYGPNEYHKANMRSFVMRAFEQIQRDGRVKLFKSQREDYADGEQKRDFIYIRDAAAMTLFMLENADVNGLFNVGTGAARSWNDLAGAVFSAMNKEPVIEYIDMPGELAGKYQYYTQANIEKIRAAGFDDEITGLEEGVNEYVNDYLLKNEYLGG